MINNVYIRADANPVIGTGHLVRTGILADKLTGYARNITFICKEIPKELKADLERRSFDVVLLNDNGNELDQIKKIIAPEKSILITDSDRDEFYTKEFQLGIKNSGTRLMMITFSNQNHFYADIVLNQNIMALAMKYSCEPGTKLLLGPKNVILNDDYREVFNTLDANTIKEEGKTVLLTFGGVDYPDRTSFVLKALLNSGAKLNKIIVVLGAMYANEEMVRKLAESSSVRTEIYRNTTKMPYLFADSDIVFTSGGLTVWEAGIFKNLVVVMAFSDREQKGGRYLGDNGFGLYLGIKDDYTLEKLTTKVNDVLNENHTRIRNNLYSNIDVNGIQNVINAILEVV